MAERSACPMLKRALEIAEAAITAPTPEAASEGFFASLGDLGASYLQTRIYRRPLTSLTSGSHFAAGGLAVRHLTTSVSKTIRCWKPSGADRPATCSRISRPAIRRLTGPTGRP